MPQENVELVRSLSQPFAGIDVTEVDWTADSIRDLLEPGLTADIELRTLTSGLASGVDDVYQGIEGLIRYFQDWFDPFSEYRIEWVEYIESGDAVLVPSRQWGVGGASGAPAELEITYLFEFRDGRIALIEQYETLRDAQAAATQRHT
jgi:ketosteroid isomerase-like protein